MTGPDHADIVAACTALRFVRVALAARRESTTAFDKALESFNTATTAAIGSPESPAREDGWVTTAEAAERLHCSERWARDLAPRIGGRKVGGRWLIPKASLPEQETVT